MNRLEDDGIVRRVGWMVAAAPLLVGCSVSLPPPVPVGAPVPVSFSGPSDGAARQVLISGEGRKEQTCDLPCTMQVPSGSALIGVTGPRKILVPAVVPSEPSQAELKFQRRGQAIAGWVLTLAGLAGGSIALGVTRNGDADAQLKGGIAGATLAGVGLVGLIIALTSGKDEVVFKGAPVGAAPASVGEARR